VDENDNLKWLRVRAEDLVNAWVAAGDALMLYEDTGDELALLIALRQGDHILATVSEDDELWARVEELQTLGVADADQWLGDLEQLVTQELDLLVEAGIPAQRAQPFLEGASRTIRRYLELRERGEDVSLGQLREGIYNLSREVSAARAELESALAERPERTPVPREQRRTRYFRLAVRALHVAGGIVEIVVDVSAAHATFGVTLISVLHGASEIGDGLAATG
jgi:hypothetical protein